MTRLKDIAKIIDIFHQYPQESTKWLNFLDFAKAYKLYTNNKFGVNQRNYKNGIT